MTRHQPIANPPTSSVVLSRALTTEAASIASATHLGPSHPSTSSIPRTSPSRLVHPSVAPTPFPDAPIPADTLPTLANDVVDSSNPATVLYLAYGSNLCAETFLGVRGIRPLSQVNVSAPSLRLTFDLPGIPYREPCFANTAIRKIPKPPSTPPKLPPDWPSPPHAHAQDGDNDEGSLEEDRDGAATATYPGDPVWDGGLIGVVYEVTAEDYAKIMATEGGGSSYADILVPCLALPPRVGVPEKPPYPELPRPFLAHTLFAPRVPAGPGQGEGEGEETEGGGDGDDGGDDGKWKLPGWVKRLLLPVRRPEPEYAQPSARYLKLIRDGAREHELPDEYQAYLARLRPYATTSRRQTVGMVLFLALWAAPFLTLFGVGRLLADARTGRMPRWMAGAMAATSNLMWMSYDGVFRPLFGDGERTVDGPGRLARRTGWGRREGGIRLGDEEEGVGLMAGR